MELIALSLPHRQGRELDVDFEASQTHQLCYSVSKVMFHGGSGMELGFFSSGKHHEQNASKLERKKTINPFYRGPMCTKKIATSRIIHSMN
jgi:hypothetical protein